MNECARVEVVLAADGRVLVNATCGPNLALQLLERARLATLQQPLEAPSAVQAAGAGEVRALLERRRGLNGG